MNSAKKFSRVLPDGVDIPDAQGGAGGQAVPAIEVIIGAQVVTLFNIISTIEAVHTVETLSATQAITEAQDVSAAGVITGAQAVPVVEAVNGPQAVAVVALTHNTTLQQDFGIHLTPSTLLHRDDNENLENQHVDPFVPTFVDKNHAKT
ncbi:hypothetical protein BGZ51_008010 [Haplosporangium sp. Z 767]|nr:hypothetical protein BGZ50_008121 [Haplosporangium sp. Z 11]KAF9178232.1 hypothetical protein BGZ51_008010 [Haplosporangium sp. Z 767]